MYSIVSYNVYWFFSIYLWCHGVTNLWHSMKRNECLRRYTGSMGPCAIQVAKCCKIHIPPLVWYAVYFGWEYLFVFIVALWFYPSTQFVNPLGHPLYEQVKMYIFFPSTLCFNQEKNIHNMHFCLSRSLLSLSFLLEYYQEEFFFFFCVLIFWIILRARLGLRKHSCS